MGGVHQRAEACVMIMFPSIHWYSQVRHCDRRPMSDRGESAASQSRTSCWLSCSRKLRPVLRNPSTSGIRARQPKAGSRLTSNCFSGVPSGLLASQWISPGKPVAAATSSVSSRMVAPAQTRRPRPDHPHAENPAAACRFVETADQRRQHVAVGGVVVVARPIQIGGIKAVLPVVLAIAYHSLVGSRGPVRSAFSRIGCSANLG